MGRNRIFDFFFQCLCGGGGRAYVCRCVCACERPGVCTCFCVVAHVCRYLYMYTCEGRRLASVSLLTSSILHKGLSCSGNSVSLSPSSWNDQQATTPRQLLFAFRDLDSDPHTCVKHFTS